MSAFIDLPLVTSYADPSTGLRVTKNIGTAAGAPATVQLGDGSTSASYPTPAAPHGFSFDGNDYLVGNAGVSGTYSFGCMCQGDRVLFGCSTGGISFDGGTRVVTASTGTVYIDGVQTTAGGSKDRWKSIIVSGITLSGSAVYIGSPTSLVTRWMGYIVRPRLFPYALTQTQVLAEHRRYQRMLKAVRP